MNSSTSSSNAVYLKILLTILLGMGAALGIVRVFTELNDARADTFLGRVLEASAALPEIVASEKPVVMVFGSSMVQAGFSPREFDQFAAQRGGRGQVF